MILQSDRPGLLFPFFDETTGRVWAFDVVEGHAVILDPAASPSARRPSNVPPAAVGERLFLPTGMSPDGTRTAGFLYPAVADRARVGWHDLRTGETTILDTPAQGAAAWLPDGQRLVFVTADRDLVVVDTRTTREQIAREALPFSVSATAPAVSPDGHSIFLGAASAESDVWIVERGR